MTASPRKKLLEGQSPVPPLPGDVSKDIAFDGCTVQVASCQGKRPYQEDRFLVDTIDVDARQARSFLADIFSAAAKKTNPNPDGSTGTALVITKDHQLRVAFLGDSPAVVFVRDPATGDITARKLTRDHHAANPAEKERIEREGGYVAFNGRVDGSLMLSRAFGDGGYIGVSQNPEFAVADLKKEIDAGKDVYVCVSSDGLYETLGKSAYIKPLRAAITEGKDDSLADIFAAYAHAQGSSDNITALVVKVPREMKEGLFMVIADGHGGAQTSTDVIDSFKDSLAKRKSLPKP
jgi:serine/threonine protein phosphatase PrpC